ncbi:hypothetical protein KAR91_50435 [Candidatus Pacearchaeota archaeon]|nr:hypothetical protein [Candidatus Pacearchaeota archaeon]
MSLLEFAESVANSKSEQLHAFRGDLIRAARKAVKAEGGKLDAIGRYPKGGTVPKPHSRYVDGKWTKSTYNPEIDEWIEL